MRIFMLSSSCDFGRRIGMLSSLEVVSWTCTSSILHGYHHLVISTDASAWYHHLVISTNASSCYHHLVPRSNLVVSWTCTSSCYHHLVTRSLCSPNEDFGRPDQPFRMGFRSTFQRFVAQIEYSRPWKVLRKRIRKSWFDLPKSSFGRGKVELDMHIFMLSSSCDSKLSWTESDTKCATL